MKNIFIGKDIFVLMHKIFDEKYRSFTTLLKQNMIHSN